VDGKSGVVSRRNHRVGNAHKEKVKLTFSNGAKPSGSRQALQCGPRRQQMAGDRSFRGRQAQWAALKKLVRAAIDYNQSKLKKKAPALRARK